MNKKAFSLIELIVGITISMLLMVSIGIFVSSGMSNIFNQQKTIQNSSDFSYFISRLNSAINSYSTGDIVTTGSGILFKSEKSFGNGGFTYIGTETLSGVYCNSDSETPETNSLFIKNFIPFEENGENIFSNYEDIITSTSGIYTSYQKEHVIKNDSGNIIIGKGVFGDKFEEATNGTEIYLNSPTGLTSSGNILFLSDTLNNRILYYDTSTSLIYKLLDESDGLNEPTGLYYRSSENALYIANSGNGEILKYSSDSISSNPNLNLSLSGVTIPSINRFSIELLTGSINISSPNEFSEISNFGFTNYNDGTDYLTGSSNKIDYYFANYSSDTYTPNSLCTGNYDYYTINSSNNPIRKVINDCNGSTGTLVEYTGNLSTNIISGTNYEINISNISPNINNTGSYFVNLKLFNGNNLEYLEYFPYFTQGDDNILTPDDNTLEVVYSGLNYPTGIWGTGSSDFNEFLDSSYSNLNFSEYDELLKVPLKSLSISYSPNDLLSIVIKYYRAYDCYNTDKKSEKTFIINKNLKN